MKFKDLTFVEPGQSVYILSAFYWAFYCTRKFEDLLPELRADRRSRLSNAAAAVWPTDSRKFEARDAQGLLKKYCIKFTVRLTKLSTI